MSPPLKGIFAGEDHDLELTFDEEHFNKNLDVLNKLKVGSDIRFTGYLRNIGLLAGHRLETQHDGKKMPTFAVFDLEIVSLEDELKTDLFARKSHHHVHKEGRYNNID